MVCKCHGLNPFLMQFVDPFVYFLLYRCLNKLKQEFVQDLATKYGGERLVEIDMDS